MSRVEPAGNRTETGSSLSCGPWAGKHGLNTCKFPSKEEQDSCSVSSSAVKYQHCGKRRFRSILHQKSYASSNSFQKGVPMEECQREKGISLA